MNRLHSQRTGGSEVLFAVVHEQRAMRVSLRHPERALVDGARRLADTQPAGAEEDVEQLAEPEVPNAILVQLAGFVVQRRHANAVSSLEAAHDRDAGGKGDAQPEHEAGELLASKPTRRPEHGDVEVLVERQVARLERPNGLLVSVLEVVLVETEPLARRSTLLTVPTIGAEHATDIEEHPFERGHPTSTARAGAPSRSPSLRGRQRSS